MRLRAVSTDNGLAGAPIRAPKTGEVVAASLRRQIVRGEISEGEMLPAEAELVATYGVSRPSLREAFRILESEGLVVMRRGVHGGARAARPTTAVAANYIGTLMQTRGVTLADVLDARLWIEPAAARLLAERRSRSAAVRTLRSLLDDELAAVNDQKEYVAATSRFHEQLVELSGNRTLSLLWETLHHVLSVEILDVAAGGEMRHQSVERRQELCSHLLNLISEGSADEVESFWREQLVRARKNVSEPHATLTIADVQGTLDRGTLASQERSASAEPAQAGSS